MASRIGIREGCCWKRAVVWAIVGGIGFLPGLTPLAALADSVQASPSAAALSGDRELGEYLSAECVTCHQPGRAAPAGIPSIAGLSAADFIAAMKEYRHRKRPNPVMQMIAGQLSEGDIASLALYFGGIAASSH